MLDIEMLRRMYKEYLETYKNNGGTKAENFEQFKKSWEQWARHY